MRHAKGVRQHGAKPLVHTFTFAQGVGGWGAAPLARSTPTLHTRAQRNVGKGTPIIPTK
ncbi:MAG: hypothetical protein NZ455_05530 [Bacteroidia bacterium]|nr:hypothetical protein [Bacteroidia bacterium]MDW8347515.1 hypothetical protein [Bacteroidia bacterium]